MKTVLFAWELGANLGHVLPMARIAGELAGSPARCIFAVRDLEYACTALAASDISILQAPLWPHHRSLSIRSPLASFADVLGAIGFGDPLKLEVTTRAWRELLDLIKPDLIVSDHSPALLLSAFGEEIPIVAVGTCFTLPPLNLDRFPPLRPESAPAMSEGRLLEAARIVQKARNRRQPHNLVEVFRTQARFVFGLPELDPYQPFRTEAVHAPPGGLPGVEESCSTPQLFVYLGTEFPQLELLTDSLADLDVTVECYIRGQGGSVAEVLRRRGHVVHDRPPDLEAVLKRCSHVFTQGGALTSAAAFSAGRPQMIAPLHQEALLNLQMLQRYKVAHQLPFRLRRRALVRQLRAFLTDKELQKRAEECARRLSVRPLEDGGKACSLFVRKTLGLDLVPHAAWS